MNNPQFASKVNEEFILIKIKRAFSGISYIKVSNSGRFYAELRLDNYTFYNGNEYSGKRTLEAAITIFQGLIGKYTNFECDGIYYYRSNQDGKWYWFPR